MCRLLKAVVLVLLFPGVIQGQITNLSLQQAQDISQKNYPAIRQKDLVKQTEALTIGNLQKGFLPQITVSAQASYQSEVTKINVSLPGLQFDAPAQDQYKLLADISQLLYDGGLTKEQKVTQQLNAAVEDQKVDVELYKLRERINQLFLSIIYLDIQYQQVELLRTDINNGLREVEAKVQQGVAFRSNANMLKAELLKAEQRGIEIISSRKGLLAALSIFLGQPLDEHVVLEKPVPLTTGPDESISRPELELYKGQADLIEQQMKLIHARNLPRASLFAQGGYGRPGLNLLKSGFDFYFIGGFRLSWSLGNLYTKKKDLALIEINKKSVDIQKETFVLNTSSQLKQQRSEIDKLQQLIASDKEIISLRNSVKMAAKAQLENGVIMAGDYYREVNAEDLARQALSAHEIQLIQAQINYQIISGKQ